MQYESSKRSTTKRNLQAQLRHNLGTVLAQPAHSLAQLYAHFMHNSSTGYAHFFVLWHTIELRNSRKGTPYFIFGLKNHSLILKTI